jgi:hypothetical protein
VTKLNTTGAVQPSWRVRTDTTILSIVSWRLTQTGVLCIGGVRVKLGDRLASIDANVDDVQSGAEACSRAANTLIADTSRLDGHLKGPIGQVLARHVKDLQACARDQRAAVRELRSSLARLREELTVPKHAAIRPPARAASDPEEV